MRRSAPPSSRCVANEWRSRCGWGRSRRSVLVSSRRPRVETKKAFSAPRTRWGGPRAGRAAAGTRPLRRAGRRGPCPPCHGRGPIPARSRRRRGRARRPRRHEDPPSRRARPAPCCAAAAARRRRALQHRLDLAAPQARPEAGGRVRWASGMSGTRPFPSVKRRNARTAASFRATVAGASLRGNAAGPGRGQLGGVRGEQRNVDVVERPAALLEPGAELRHVEAVGAAGRVREAGALEEAVDCAFCVHRRGVRRRRCDYFK